jgi:hypothetical protein
MKKRKLKRPAAGPPNLAARALGDRIFGLKVVTPKKGYNRKLKHKHGSQPNGLFASAGLRWEEPDTE